MSGPVYASPFPKGRLSTVWDYLVSQLRADTVLQAAVDDWMVYGGDIDDTRPTNIGRDSRNIVLELRSQSGNLRWTDEQRHGGNWNITLNLYLPTHDEGAALDGWEAVYNAIPWPNEATHYSTMVTTNGCYEIVMIGPAFSRQDAASGGGMLVSGTIQLLFNVFPRATS